MQKNIGVPESRKVKEIDKAGFDRGMEPRKVVSHCAPESSRIAKVGIATFEEEVRPKTLLQGQFSNETRRDRRLSSSRVASDQYDVRCLLRSRR